MYFSITNPATIATALTAKMAGNCRSMKPRALSPNSRSKIAHSRKRPPRVTAVGREEGDEVELRRTGGYGDDLERNRQQAFEQDDPQSILCEARLERRIGGLVVVQPQQGQCDLGEQGVADQIAEDAAQHAAGGANCRIAQAAVGAGQRHRDQQRVRRQREETGFRKGDGEEPGRRVWARGQQKDAMIAAPKHGSPSHAPAFDTTPLRRARHRPL